MSALTWIVLFVALLTGAFGVWLYRAGEIVIGLTCLLVCALIVLVVHEGHLIKESIIEQMDENPYTPPKDEDKS